MPLEGRYDLVYAPEVIDHLRAINRKHHPLIKGAIEEQLRFTPAEVTRNRKPLKVPAPFEAARELRCGPENRYRVFYEVERDTAPPEEGSAPERAGVVAVLAVGEKRGNRLFFAGEEFAP